MNDVYQINDVLIVAQLLQDSDLTDGRARDAVVTVVNLDLLNGDYLERFFLDRFVNNSVGTFTQL